MQPNNDERRVVPKSPHDFLSSLFDTSMAKSAAAAADQKPAEGERRPLPDLCRNLQITPLSGATLL